MKGFFNVDFGFPLLIFLKEKYNIAIEERKYLFLVPAATGRRGMAWFLDTENKSPFFVKKVGLFSDDQMMSPDVRKKLLECHNDAESILIIYQNENHWQRFSSENLSLCRSSTI